jgi:heme-degrading monooxygenase HmoA
MIAIIFEVEPADGKQDSYLEIAANLRDHLEKIDGFISVERFQSITNPKKLLSLSFFENEDAVKEWRNLEVHREAQNAGRSGIFKDYRLRVASVMRDYGLNECEAAPLDSKKTHG